jgi:hypothetical protein
MYGLEISAGIAVALFNTYANTSSVTVSASTFP